VLVAGAVVIAQGLAGLVFVVALIVRGLDGSQQLGIGKVFGEAAYFALVVAGVLVVGAGLVRARRWARTPAVVLQLLLLGVAWYVLGPSDRPEYGFPLGLVSITVIGLLFTGQARRWAWGEEDSHLTD
jgi:hypothetical protein